MRNVILGVTAIVTWFAVAASLSAQQAAPGDWPHFNRDKGSSRYVPLDQINTTNVTRLQPAWTFSAVPETPPAAPGGPGPAGRAGGAGRGGRGAGGGVGAQVVPVVVNGVMYVPAGNVVVALDGATGKEVWRYTVTSGAASNRGVNYWPGNGTAAPRIVFTTRGQTGNSLVALDAATGKPSAGFGVNGIADMGGVGWSGVPVVFRNTLADSVKRRSLAVTVLDAKGRWTRFGAEVRLLDAAGKVIATRQVPTGGGYNSQSAAPVHFGLAKLEPVTVEVTFMSASGRKKQTMKSVNPADYYGKSLVIKEAN